MPSQEDKEKWAKELAAKDDTGSFTPEWYKFMGIPSATAQIHKHVWVYQSGGKYTIRHCSGCKEFYVLHEVKFSHGIEYKWRKVND